MKPRPAPKFRSDKELLEEIRRTQPEIAEAATKKDEHLHKNLQDVRHAYIAFLTPISPFPLIGDFRLPLSFIRPQQ